MYEKIVRSGKLLEYYKYELTPIGFQRDRNAGHSRTKPDRKGYKKHAARRADNVQRSVRAFRRLVRANLVGDENPALLTLTMYQILPYAKSCKLFTEFIVRLRKREGSSFRYIAVPEFQKRGATHWHLLIWGLDEEVIYTERTSRYLARLWLRGFCDITPTDGHAKLATYLTKYLRKAMQNLRYSGTKAYYSSRNVIKTMSVGSNSLTDYIEEIVDIHSVPLTTHEFHTEWLGKCDYKSYKIST